MIGLIKRNLLIYFSSIKNVLLSMLGALIIFVLYIVFLKHDIQLSWSQIPNVDQLLNPWLIGGTLTVTAMTTSLNTLGHFIIDCERNTLADISMTDLSQLMIQSSYMISSIIISFIMQILMLIITGGYFNYFDDTDINFAVYPKLLLIMAFTSIIWVIVNFFIINLIKKVNLLYSLNSIVGALSGFLAGTYLPIGSVPLFAQSVMKLTPAPYNVAIFREILMKDQINNELGTHVGEFNHSMGINIYLNHSLNLIQEILVLFGFIIAFSLLLILVNRLRKNKPL